MSYIIVTGMELLGVAGREATDDFHRILGIPMPIVTTIPTTRLWREEEFHHLVVN